MDKNIVRNTWYNNGPDIICIWRSDFHFLSFIHMLHFLSTEQCW